MQQNRTRAGLALCATLALTGCIVGKPAKESFAWKGPVAPNSWLRLRNISGDFNVRQTDGDSAEIQLEIVRSNRFAPEVEVKVLKIGDDVVACVLYGRRGDCSATSYRGGGSDTYNKISFFNGSTSARGTILVPRGVHLDVESTNGDVNVASLSGDVSVTTVNGGIDVRGARRSVRLHTTNGDVQLGSDSLGGELQVETTNGDVVLELPLGLNAALTMHTVNGDLGLGMPVNVTTQTPKSIIAQLGSGGSSIKLQTTNGDISLKQRTP
jgi:Putative adhesin